MHILTIFCIYYSIYKSVPFGICSFVNWSSHTVEYSCFASDPPTPSDHLLKSSLSILRTTCKAICRCLTMHLKGRCLPPAVLPPFCKLHNYVFYKKLFLAKAPLYFIYWQIYWKSLDFSCPESSFQNHGLPEPSTHKVVWACSNVGR